MDKLPVLSGREVVRRLKKVGFVLVRRKGSHMILRREMSPTMTVTVPDHGKLKRGTLKNILRQIGLTVEEIEKLK